MYRVEHQDTSGVWHKSHRGSFKSYSAALAKRDEVGGYGRIVQKIGNVWEECATRCQPERTEVRGIYAERSLHPAIEANARKFARFNESPL